MEGQYDYVLGDHKGHTALNQGEQSTSGVTPTKTESARKMKVESGWFESTSTLAGAEPQSQQLVCMAVRSFGGGWGGDPWQNFIHQMKADPDHRYKYTVIDGQHMPTSSPKIRRNSKAMDSDVMGNRGGSRYVIPLRGTDNTRYRLR